MGTTVVGIVLIVIGIAALLGGIGGGVAHMFLEIKEKARQGQSGLMDLPEKTVEALIKLIDALTKAPLWLALSVIGILLVAWGGSML